MRVAVTGATGFIGRRVVPLLRAGGHEVVCVARRPEAAQELAASGARVVKGDLLDRPSLEAAFAGCAGVVHLAASYEIGLRGRAAREAMTTNIEGTRNALEAARDAGARHIVYTSSIVVHGTTGGRVVDETFRYPGRVFPSVYAESKYRAHYEVAEPLMRGGAPISIVLPGAVLGPGDTSLYNLMHELAAAGLPVPVGAAQYGAVSVDDCARGLVLALERGRPGELYHLVSENLSLRDLARRGPASVGLPVRIVALPDWALLAQLALARFLERFIALPRLLSSDAMGGQLSSLTAIVSNEKARRELGWEPAPVDDALREALRFELEKRGRRLPGA